MASFLGQSSFDCRVLFAKAWKGTKGTLLFLYFRTLRGEGGELAMFLLQLCLSKQTSNRVSTMPLSLSLTLGNCQMKGWGYDFKLELP